METLYKEQYPWGWILLSLLLTVGLIVFIVLWAICINENNQSQTTSFGTYGVQPGVDAVAINACGQNKNTACVFSKNSLADCETECNNLKSICSAFTFNFSTSTMKIVNKNAAFVSSSANLFVRQS